MDLKERTQLMDMIAKAGDRMALKFATRCMMLLELNCEVTIDDIEAFAQEQGLV